MNVVSRTIGIVLITGLAFFVAGCPVGPAPDPCAGVTCGDGETCVNGVCVSSEPEEFQNASATRGGALYDKWWNVDGVTASEPTDDHPLWATQDTNARGGADTWRCKECHGWDYKGVDGAYGSGSHMTGFPGIFGTEKTPQEAFDLIQTDHGLGDAGLADADIWDLAKFVLEGQIDTDDILVGTAFTGSAEAGQTSFDSTCAACHGADGQTIDFGDGEFVGGLANGNPWEFQHKVRFGQPGTPMPPQVDVLTLEQVNDLSAYSQTLP